MKQIILPMLLVFTIAFHVKAQTTIIDVTASSKDHSTLSAAIKAAELTDVLKAKGPFTLFAPSNAAFEKIPQDVLGNLLKPESKKDLSSILSYHVVQGSFDAAGLGDAITKGNGVYVIQTVNGSSLTATFEEGKIKLTDAKGGICFVTNADIKASNGIILMEF
jgi:uncharacterized surface protein with fasciclin (FAS1) repeats